MVHVIILLLYAINEMSWHLLSGVIKTVGLVHVILPEMVQCNPR